MGTKRPFDEELQELIKNPNDRDCGNGPASFAENKLPLEPFQDVGIAGEGGRKCIRTGDDPESENVVTVPDMIDKDFDTSAPLPLVTGTSTDEEIIVGGPVFGANLFSELFEYNFPRRQILHYGDIYSSLLNGSPRKETPIGPAHQADIPEFDSELAKNYRFDNGGMDRFLGVCVIPIPHSNSDYLAGEDNEASDIQKGCECLDGGSIRCVQQHVKEARMKLIGSLGHEKFADLGMVNMGQEVARWWTGEEERVFHEVVYLNPPSLGRVFWNQFSVTLPSRTKKELVSYYFNVFMLQRRAVQNRATLLEIDSDDDEWRESEGGTFRLGMGSEEFVVGESSASHGDHDSSSGDDVDSKYDDGNGDGDGSGAGGGGEGDFVIGVTEDSCTSFEDPPLEPNSKKVDAKSPVTMDENKVPSEGEPVNDELKSEDGFEPSDGKVWDTGS